MACVQEPETGPGEKVAIIGSPWWSDFALRVTFRILTNSASPPQGGAIVYLLFKNIRNHYSFHFCLCKRKVEFIRRLRGTWSTLAQQGFDFEVGRSYSASVSTRSGIHRCQIDGANAVEIRDMGISRGCVGVGAKYCTVEFCDLSLSIP